MTDLLCIRQLIEVKGRQIPEDIAILAPGRLPLTYASLRRHTYNVTKQLHAMGVTRNDRIAIVLPNGPEMAMAFLAVAAGATAAPLNPAYRSSEFEFYLSDLDAKALIVQAGIDSPATAVAQRLRIPVIELSPRLKEEAGIFALAGCEPTELTAGDHGRPDDIALVLHTSGTTSRPKIVPLTHSNICISARNVSVALNLTADDRCLNIMPLFHIHGLIGAVLSSLMAGGSVVCTQGLQVSSFFQWMDEFKPTWYTATPTMHQAILAVGAVNQKIIARRPLRFIRSCSSPLPPQVMLKLEKAFRAPVIEAYGMTEASHQIASNPLPPLRRKTGSVGVPFGCEVEIMDLAGNLLAPGETAEIVIRGFNVTFGYENNAAANQSSFTNGWFRTGDRGYIDPDGYLFITGRLKEIINRGGEKISPREVDEVLLEHPAIVQAVSFATPHTTLGEDVAAAIVTRDGMAVTEREVREFASQRLAHFKVPHRVVIVEEIPKGPTGKVQRVGLAEKLRVTQPDRWGNQMKEVYAAPRNPTEEIVANLWAKLFGLKRIGIHDDFFELGGDSLLAAPLFAQLEKVVGRSLPLGIIFEAPTVAELAKALQQEARSSIVPIQSEGSKCPLFGVHAAAGEVLFYRELVSHLGPDQPFYGLQAQGLDGKRLTCFRFEDMAAHYVKEMRRVQSRGPYLMAGYSLGAILAYEMAQQLKKQGEEVALLILLDPTPPGKSESSSNSAGSAASTSRLGQIAASHAELSRHWRNLSLLTFREKLTYIGTRVIGQMTNGTAVINDVYRKIICNVYVAIGHPLTPRLRRFYLRGVHKRALHNYVPEPYSGHVVLFRGGQSDREWRSVWSKLIHGELEIHEVPGAHGSFIREPNVQVWAQTLKDCLDRQQPMSSIASAASLRTYSHNSLRIRNRQLPHRRNSQGEQQWE
jgi:acyl-CoA synthetase (AMP-forming)/AMP-acid ligase II/thioesterase domain-containing protein